MAPSGEDEGQDVTATVSGTPVGYSTPRGSARRRSWLQIRQIAAFNKGFLDPRADLRGTPDPCCQVKHLHESLTNNAAAV